MKHLLTRNTLSTGCSENPVSPDDQRWTYTYVLQRLEDGKLVEVIVVDKLTRLFRVNRQPQSAGLESINDTEGSHSEFKHFTLDEVWSVLESGKACEKDDEKEVEASE